MKNFINSIIAKRIMNKYASYMGDYFDFIQGNEEEEFQEALTLVNNAPIISKIKMLVRGYI